MRGASPEPSHGESRAGATAGQAAGGTADAPVPGFAFLLSLAMAQFMVVLDFTIVNVALPSIQGELHVATTTLQWLVSAYAVAFGGFLLLGGRLSDAYGRARLYRIGRERSRALGTYGAVVSAGFASGAVLGGLLAEVTWRLVFFVNVPIGIALLAASLRLLPADPPARHGQLDIPGAVTATAGVALLVPAVVRAGDTLQATQPALLGAAAIALLAAFVFRERRAPAPLLDLTLLKDPHHLFRHHAGGIP